MRLSVTRAISNITTKKFEEMLKNGAFPEVEFKETESGGMKWKSYAMFAYSNTHARYMKLIDWYIKGQLKDELGIFTRKHSAGFLLQVETIVASVTEEEVLNFGERFRSFADNF